MLKKYIVNLRHKPKPVRDRVALLCASVFTAMVFTVWLYHAPARYAAIEAQNLDTVANQSPGFSELLGNLKEAASSLKETINSASSTVASSTKKSDDTDSATPAFYLKDTGNNDMPPENTDITPSESVEDTSTTSLMEKRTPVTSNNNDLESLFKFEGFDEYYDENELPEVKEVRVIPTPVATTSESKEAESAP